LRGRLLAQERACEVAASLSSLCVGVLPVSDLCTALQAARDVLLAMRDIGDIGDDAFHTLENDMDWMEVSDPLRAANADATQ
jgi:hypothetical protein